MFATLAGVSLFAQTVVPSAGVFGATYSQELQDAYNWAYGKGVTTMSTIDNANMYGAITRAEMAKMLSVYATEVLGYEADTSKACNFTDIDSVKGDLHDYIIKSCQLGLMGQGITAFRPYDTISRAEFGTALSRTLWGNQYEGGTPYYANHLNALKAAGIMNQIANAESTKEVRGYVMLMLMRSEGNDAVVDCDDPVIALACNLDSEDCPAACKSDSKDEDNKDEDEVVRSGDLAVSAEAAEGRKAIIGGTSDLDTLTFKTSEEVTISKITLERYGYSTIDDVISVQLEDEDGNIIADAKELNSKGQVNLSIKKDYKSVDGTYRATVVVNTRELGLPASSYIGADAANAAVYASGKNGSTLWFKVVDVESTAKNLNVDKYSPYTYDLVNYDGSKVEFSSRNSATKDYSYEAGEMYEVAKFRVKAPNDAAILIKGFTMDDDAGDDIAKKIDASKYVSKVEVTVDGEEVDGLKWNINKEDELVLSFKDVELAAKQNSTFVVKASFNEDFDQFDYSIQYNIASMDKFNAIDKKTESRVKMSTEKPLSSVTWTTYTIKWWKIKLTGSKLWTVNAAAGATNVKIAEWNITVTEALRWTASIKINATNKAKIDEIRLVINWEEYDGTSSTDGYIFKGLEIDKSGKVEVRVDIKDEQSGNIEFDGSLSSDLFSLKYDESGKPVDTDQIVGSISLSNIRIQAAKAELEKSNTKDVELIHKESNRKTILEGKYSAKKGAVTLKNFTIKPDSSYGFNTGDKVTFYVTIDNEEYDAVYDYTTWLALWTIDDIEVADGKSVNVKVEIEMTPKATATGSSETFNIKLEWEDEDNNPAGEADEDTAKVKVVEQGTLNINSSAKNTVLLKSKKTIAEFTVKPSKAGDDDIVLKSIEFDGAGISTGNIKVTVDGETFTSNTLTYEPGVTVPSNGVVVKVTLKNELTGDKVLEVKSINGNTSAKATFRKYFVSALLSIHQQKNGDTTRYTVDVDNDTSDTVSDLHFYVNGSGECKTAADVSTTKCEDVAHITDSLSETDNTLSAINWEKAKSITAISYKVWSDTYFISKDTYEDFFKIGADDLMVYSNK